RCNRGVDDEMAVAARIQMKAVDAGNMLARGAGTDLAGEVARKHFVELASDRFVARNSEQVFELRIPRFDAVLEIDSKHADLKRFDDIFAEVFEALDLQRLLLERLIEARVFNGDGDVSGDSREKFEVFAREIVAVNRLAEAENCGGAVVEAAGDEIVEVEFLERMANRVGFPRGAGGFKEEAATRERRPRRVEKTQIEGAFGAESHRAGQHEPAGIIRILEENGEAIDEQRLGKPIEHGAEERINANFIRERAAELDECAAIVEAVAIKKVVEARLHPVAQRLKEKCGDDDGDHRSEGARRQGAVRKLANERDRREVDRNDAGGGERISEAALEDDVHVHQAVADDGVAEAQRNQRERIDGNVHPRLGNDAEDVRQEIEEQERQDACERAARDPLQLLT